MPEISRFYGIIVRMYFGDHAPPHFHAFYEDEEALIDIAKLSLICGHLQPRALGMVIEWASLHQKELMKFWGKAAKNQPLAKIEPLP